jgi:hypothetical protein
MFSAKRIAGAAEVPTVVAPAGTPGDIVIRMAVEIGKAVASTDVKSRFETIGIELVGNKPEETQVPRRGNRQVGKGDHDGWSEGGTVSCAVGGAPP